MRARTPPNDGGLEQLGGGPLKSGCARLRCNSQQRVVALPSLAFFCGRIREYTRELRTGHDVGHASIDSVQGDVHTRVERCAASKIFQGRERGGERGDPWSRRVSTTSKSNEIPERGTDHVDVLDRSERLHVAKVAIARKSFLSPDHYPVQLHTGMRHFGNKRSRGKLLERHPVAIGWNPDDGEIRPSVWFDSGPGRDDQSFGKRSERNEGLRPIESVVIALAAQCRSRWLADCCPRTRSRTGLTAARHQARALRGQRDSRRRRPAQDGRHVPRPERQAAKGERFEARSTAYASQASFRLRNTASSGFWASTSSTVTEASAIGRR